MRLPTKRKTKYVYYSAALGTWTNLSLKPNQSRRDKIGTDRSTITHSTNKQSKHRKHSAVKTKKVMSGASPNLDPLTILMQSRQAHKTFVITPRPCTSRQSHDKHKKWL